MKRLCCISMILFALANSDLVPLTPPEEYQSFSVITFREIKMIKGILLGDIWMAYPDVYEEYEYKSDLEREVFLESAEAESLKQDIVQKRDEILEDLFAIKIRGDRIEDYDLKKGCFQVDIGKDVGYYGIESKVYAKWEEKAKHIVEDIWFENLPIKLDYGRILVLKIDKSLALDIERSRDDLNILIAFKLTGDLKKMVFKTGITITEYFVMAKDAAVMLVTKEGDIVWFRRYTASK